MTCTPSSSGRWVRARAEHDRPHRPGLARPGPADHGEVTGGVREVDRQRVAALQVRPVDHADGHLQRPAGHGYREAPSRPDRGTPSTWSRGGARIQRGQPHPVCRRSPPDHRRDHRVEHRGAVRLRLRRRPRAVRPAPARRGKRWARRGAGGPAAGPDRRRRRSGRRRTRPGTGPARPSPWRGRPSPGAGGSSVGVRHAQHRARLGSGERAQRDPVGQVRIEPAQPALVEPLRREQQVDRRAIGRAARSCPRRSTSSGRWASSSENSSTTTSSAGSGGSSRPGVRRAAAYSATPARLPAARSSSWRRVISPVSASAIRSTSVQLVGQVGDHRGDVRQARRGRGRWRRP